MGKDSWLKFHGGVNKAGVKIAAGVYGIPIKGDLKFNKVELFLEVRCDAVVKAGLHVVFSDQFPRHKGRTWLSLPDIFKLRSKARRIQGFYGTL